MRLDITIHQPVRLRVMSALCALPEGREVSFSALRDALGVTDGNIGAHLQKLREAGYVGISKRFVDEKPRTLVTATPDGRQAFLEHVLALQEVIREPPELAGIS